MTSPTLVARNWRELIRPRNVPVDQESLSDTYGKFVVEPLERGFGITLGNSLRRVLLSSLQGAAITAVKIDGAHPMLPKLLDVHAIGENAYLVGPASSGKTTMVQQCADALGLDFHATGAVVDKFELLGFVDAGGKYHRTALREAVEHGGVFLFDEVDSSYPAPLNAFNALLENGHITFPDGATFQVDRSKTFFVCAANTLGTGANRTYVGRFELDRAFLDRFVQLEVDYDETIENRMAEQAWLSAGGSPDNTIWQVWSEHVRGFRAKLAEKNIKVLVTPRATRRGAGLLARGWDIDDVTQSELYKHLSADQLQQVLV